MNIQVNGEPQEIDGPLTISALLTQLSIEPRRVAVEHNLVVIKRHLYDSTVVGAGDTIEIVNLVGGGAAAYKGSDSRVLVPTCALFPKN